MTKSKPKNRKRTKRKRISKTSRPISNEQMPRNKRRRLNKSKSKLRTLSKLSRARLIRTEQTYFSKCPNNLKSGNNKSRNNKTSRNKSVVRKTMNRWKPWINQKWLKWKKRIRLIRKSSKVGPMNTFLTKRLNKCRGNWLLINYQTMMLKRSK